MTNHGIERTTSPTSDVFWSYSAADISTVSLSGASSISASGSRATEAACGAALPMLPISGSSNLHLHHGCKKLLNRLVWVGLIVHVDALLC